MLYSSIGHLLSVAPKRAIRNKRHAGIYRGGKKKRKSGVVILKLVWNAPIFKQEIQPGPAFLFLRAVLIEQLFFPNFPLFFKKKTGKTGNISKVWKFNRGQNTWKASHSKYLEIYLYIYGNLDKNPSIRTALTRCPALYAPTCPY